MTASKFVNTLGRGRRRKEANFAKDWFSNIWGSSAGKIQAHKTIDGAWKGACLIRFAKKDAA